MSRDTPKSNFHRSKLTVRELSTKYLQEIYLLNMHLEQVDHKKTTYKVWIFLVYNKLKYKINNNNSNKIYKNTYIVLIGNK